MKLPIAALFLSLSLSASASSSHTADVADINNKIVTDNNGALNIDTQVKSRGLAGNETDDSNDDDDKKTDDSNDDDDKDNAAVVSRVGMTALGASVLSMFFSL